MPQEFVSRSCRKPGKDELPEVPFSARPLDRVAGPCHAAVGAVAAKEVR